MNYVCCFWFHTTSSVRLNYIYVIWKHFCIRCEWEGCQECVLCYGSSSVSQVLGECILKMYFLRSGFVLNTSLENRFTAVHISLGSPTRNDTVIRFTSRHLFCTLADVFRQVRSCEIKLHVRSRMETDWLHVWVNMFWWSLPTCIEFKFPLTTYWIKTLCK